MRIIIQHRDVYGIELRNLPIGALFLVEGRDDLLFQVLELPGEGQPLVTCMGLGSSEAWRHPPGLKIAHVAVLSMEVWPV